MTETHEPGVSVPMVVEAALGLEARAATAQARFRSLMPNSAIIVSVWEKPSRESWLNLLPTQGQ